MGFQRIAAIHSAFQRQAARAQHIGLGDIQHGSRTNADGTQISWRLTTPMPFMMNGVVPFLIAWGDTPQPGSLLPQAGSLVGLEVEHPEADRVCEAYRALGVDVPVTAGPAPRITAHIETGMAVVEVG